MLLGSMRAQLGHSFEDGNGSRSLRSTEERGGSRDGHR